MKIESLDCWTSLNGFFNVNNLYFAGIDTWIIPILNEILKKYNFNQFYCGEYNIYSYDGNINFNKFNENSQLDNFYEFHDLK